MKMVCPYCGTPLEAENLVSGPTPDIVICRTCGQELDRPMDPGAEPDPLTEMYSFQPGPPEPGQGEPEPAGEKPAGPQPAPASPPPPHHEAAAQPGGEGAAYAGQHIQFRPPPGPEESPAWEGEQGGFISRLWSTTWQMLLHPVRTMAAPSQPGISWALTYALVMGTLGGALNALWGTITGWDIYSGLLENQIINLVLAPVLTLLGFFLGGLIVHLSLWILRGNKRGISATFRVMGYGQASNLWQFIPGLGSFLGGIWGIAIGIGGLAGAHGIGKWRAFFAFFLPIVFLFILGIVVVAALGLISSVLGEMQGGFIGSLNL